MASEQPVVERGTAPQPRVQSERVVADSIVGRHSCGCITYWNGRPNDVDRDTERTMARFIREGGEILRVRLDDVKDLPEFLPRECPHDPKGWEREAVPDRDRQRNASGDRPETTVLSEKSIVDRAVYLHRQAEQTDDPALARALELRALRLMAQANDPKDTHEH